LFTAFTWLVNELSILCDRMGFRSSCCGACPDVERRLIPAREAAVVPFVVGMALVVVAGLARS